MSVPAWPAVGIHPGIDPKVYFAESSPRIVSKSLLWDFFGNPRRWRDAPPKEITDAMRWGSLVDCIALTPDRFDAAYRIQPDTYVSAPADVVLTTEFEGEWNGRTKACQEWRKAREAEGKTVMTPEEHAKAAEPKPWNWNSTTCIEWRNALPPGLEVISTYRNQEARKATAALFARPEFAEMMAGGQTQVAVRYDFPELITEQPGILRGKGLLDIVPALDGPWGNSLVDLKTTGKLDDIRQIEKTIYERGYHAQAALYLDMWNAVTGEDRREFTFVFQQNVAPYEVAVVKLDAESLRIGRNWYLRAVKKWARCIALNEWPSPWDSLHVVGVPDWAEKKETQSERAA
jgi:hypothetical protein